MRLLLVTALALAACGPGLANNHELTKAVSDSFVAAVQRKDVAAIASHLGKVVAFGGMYFADSACMQKFPTPAKIDATKRDAFAACLATVPLVDSTRVDAMYAVSVYQYEPGFEIEAKFDDFAEGARVVWIGYSGRRGLFDALPTITPAALERARTAGDPRPRPSAEDAAKIEAELAQLGMKYAWVWLKVCVDTDGNVTGVHMREATSAVIERTFVPQLESWKFKPLALAGGGGVPACALLRMTHPRTDEREAIPLAFAVPAGAARIPNARVRRIEGEIRVTPPDEGKSGMMHAGIDKIAGSFAYCFDATGTVTDVRMLESTRIASYDALIQRTIGTWRFEPYVVDGKPVTACSTATFIYSQR